MSGIAGVVRLGGTVIESELEAMLQPMLRRGPDRQTLWCEGSAGFGHALLATTPEATADTQPWVHPETGCVVVSDSRLDNRPALARVLGLASRNVDSIGDGELLHAAWRRWGGDCANRLLGDFAFAIWNPREQSLFCARDIMGVRPFYFHHAPGRVFAFASETAALLALADVPLWINEGRIADALVGELEGIDRTSTFFLDIARLPPARTLRLEGGAQTQAEYWNPLQKGPGSLPSTEDEWIESVRAHLAVAVGRRLRGVGRVGAMISGGLDSSSAAALAHRMLTAAGDAPLPTFSAINSRGECAETTAVLSMLARFDFDATTVDLQHLDMIAPAVHAQLDQLGEPFDHDMTLISAVYAAAAAAGVRSILDGAPADNLYTAGFFFERLMKRGQFGEAWHQALALHRHEDASRPRLRALQTLAGACAPPSVRRWREHSRDARFYRNELLRTSSISPAFAERVDLRQRFQAYRDDMTATRLRDASGEAQSIMTAAYITAGIERYNRVASFHGIEPRHPFLDRDLVEFHAWLPLGLRLRDGHHKWALRAAMQGILPDTVAWRRGKEHLGSQFNDRLWHRLDVGSPSPASKLPGARPFLAPEEIGGGLNSWPAKWLQAWLDRMRP